VVCQQKGEGGCDSASSPGWLGQLPAVRTVQLVRRILTISRPKFVGSGKPRVQFTPCSCKESGKDRTARQEKTLHVKDMVFPVVMREYCAHYRSAVLTIRISSSPPLMVLLISVIIMVYEGHDGDSVPVRLLSENDHVFTLQFPC